MQLDALALRMRPRAPLEATDLGARLCQSAARSVYACYAAVYVPVAAVALASLIAAGQMPFAPSSFEFGVAQNFSGVLSLKPYPVLFEHGRAHVLFGSGKHGFTTSAPNGAGVTLRGSAVFFGPARGIEVTPGTLQVSGADTPPLPDPRNLGWATLTGEIVDSKCYFGVMNPGRGKFMLLPNSDHLFHAFATEQDSLRNFQRGKFNNDFSKVLKDWISSVVAAR